MKKISNCAGVLMLLIFSTVGILNAQINNSLTICEQPFKDGAIPCDGRFSPSTYQLEEFVELDPYFGEDTLSVEHKKALYFYLVSNYIKNADKVDFILRETVNAEENTYKELDKNTVNVQGKGWNMAYIKWNFEREGLFWMDAYVDDELIASKFVEIRK